MSFQAWHCKQTFSWMCSNVSNQYFWLFLVLMNAKASEKKTSRNFLCNQHILWSNICFLTDFSECLFTVLTLEWKSTSLNLNIIRLDHLTKKPWWQMHYGDFKSNLPWKHESIHKNSSFFWSSMKESPQWNLSRYWFAGLLQRILGKTIRYNMK